MENPPVRFEVRKTRNNQFRAYIIAANNEVLFVSETYHNKQDCYHGIYLIRSEAISAPIVDKTEKRAYTKRTSPKAEVTK